MTEPDWRKSLRRGLAGLLAVGVLSAFAGGYYGYHSWIEPVPAVAGALILVLALLLPRTGRSARG